VINELCDPTFDFTHRIFSILEDEETCMNHSTTRVTTLILRQASMLVLVNRGHTELDCPNEN